MTDRWCPWPVSTQSQGPDSLSLYLLFFFNKKQNFELFCQYLTRSPLPSIGSTLLIKPLCIPDESSFAWITLYSL